MQPLSTNLISLIKSPAHPAVVLLEEAQSRCQQFLEAAQTLANESMGPEPTHAARILKADSVLAACAGAVLAAQGAVRPLGERELHSEHALQLLCGELKLTSLTRAPLSQIRARARALAESEQPQPADAFLAHTASILMVDLTAWTAEHLLEAFAPAKTTLRLN